MPHMKMPRFQMAVKVTTGKGLAILRKLQLGKISVILGKERILSFPRKGVVCNWERFQ